MTDRPLVAIAVFPGSNDDRDAAWALGSVGAEPVLVWHEEPALPAGTGAVVLPGVVDLEFETDDAEAARREIHRMCEELLANPLIESFEIHVDGS